MAFDSHLLKKSFTENSDLCSGYTFARHLYYYFLGFTVIDSYYRL